MFTISYHFYSFSLKWVYFYLFYLYTNSNACIGICRDSRHKRRLTGGKVVINIKKRKFEMGRQPAMTKLGAKRIYLVRCRGGNIKHRAIRLDQGTFSWAGEGKRLLISLIT